MGREGRGERGGEAALLPDGAIKSESKESLRFGRRRRAEQSGAERGSGVVTHPGLQDSVGSFDDWATAEDVAERVFARKAEVARVRIAREEGGARGDRHFCFVETDIKGEGIKDKAEVEVPGERSDERRSEFGMSQKVGGGIGSGRKAPDFSGDGSGGVEEARVAIAGA